MNSGNALKARTVPADGNFTDEESRVRVDLAAAYRLAALHGWEDLIYTHISVRVPGKEERFLINPFGMAFEEINASSLVKIDLSGAIVGESAYPVNAGGFTIHSAVHEARPEVACVMHLHPDAGMSIAMLKCGLLPLSQHAMMFHNRIAYHDYEGPALDLEERARLVADLGAHNAMILRNHGLLTAGRSVGEAFVRMWYLVKSATTQMQAMATGAELTLVSEEVAEKTAKVHEGDSMPLGEREWPAMLRRLDRIDPSYRG